MKYRLRQFGTVYIILASIVALIASIIYARSGYGFSFLVFLVMICVSAFAIAMVAIFYFALASIMEQNERLTYKVSELSDILNDIKQGKINIIAPVGNTSSASNNQSQSETSSPEVGKILSPTEANADTVICPSCGREQRRNAFGCIYCHKPF